jgi:hypothetical protein
MVYYSSLWYIMVHCEMVHAHVSYYCTFEVTHYLCFAAARCWCSRHARVRVSMHTQIWLPFRPLPFTFARLVPEPSLCTSRYTNGQKHKKGWEEEEPGLKDIKETHPEGGGKFALGCATCMAYAHAHPDDKGAKRCQLANGSLATVKKDIIIRHFSQSVHINAEAWQSRKDCFFFIRTRVHVFLSLAPGD